MEVSPTKPALMVVDDEARFGEYVADVADELGFAVSVYKCAKDCLKAIGERNPDIVIMDIVMPDMDGVELVQAIGAQRPGQPVIVMSGYDSHYLDVVQTLGEAGGVKICGALMKPFTVDELEIALSPFLSRKGEGING